MGLRATIEACARCGDEHVDLDFQDLTRPIIADLGTYYTHWAMCPSLEEPILLAVMVEPLPQQEADIEQ